MSGDLISRLREATERAAEGCRFETRPPQDQDRGTRCRGSGEPSVAVPPNFHGPRGTYSKCRACDWTSSTGPGYVLSRHPVIVREDRWT